MIKKLVLAILFIVSLQLSAQYMEGYATSNYAGINGIAFNPASIVDTRTKLDINFISISTTINNNFLGLTTNFADPRDSTLWEQSTRLNDNDAKYAVLNADVLGPSFLYTISEKRSIAFTTKFRSIGNLNNFNTAAANLYLSRLENPADFTDNYNLNSARFTTASWNEYGFTYGQEVYRKQNHWVSLAGRFKLNQGVHAAALKVGNADFSVNPDSTIQITGEDVEYMSSQNLNNDWRSNLSKFNGWGMGVDIGVNYEFRKAPTDSFDYEMDGKIRPAYEMSKHKLRLGFTLADLGYIKFSNANLGNTNLNSNNWDPNQYDLRTLAGIEEAISNEFAVNEEKGSQIMYLPTSLSFQADYNIYKGFYANATYFHSIKRPNQLLAVNYLNRLTITPRWDWKWMGVYVPYTFEEKGNQHLGINIMFGPFLIGTRDLGTYLWNNESYYGNIHFGVKVTSHHFRPEDLDKDKVSDLLDKCPETPGIFAFNGCPDTDKDSVPDATDKCPEIAGLKIHDGCPDTDGDGLPDKMDECPLDSGVTDLAGCPDTDGDGIKNSEDECPELIGLSIFNGCPDMDGDSIVDHLDACPELPGTKEHLGCPDTDNDGVYNYADSCVNTAGPKDNNGCPYKDNDGDGIINKKDQCPNQAGPKTNNGCPLTDQDFDGILDSLDQCPKTFGDAENNGCPVINQEDELVIDFAFKNLQFKTGESFILEESYESLNNLAELLIEKKWLLRLEGHTDNVGNAQDNLKLSKSRVESTRDYLIKKGVNQSFLILKYFGETKPIDTNETPEGRQKNRRVEMEIVFE